MASEPAPASNQNNTSCNFVIPIKLDQSNFIVQRTQVLTSIKGNGIEGFITRANKSHDQYLVQDADDISPSNAGSESRIDNPAFSASSQLNDVFNSREFALLCHSLCFISRVVGFLDTCVCFSNSSSYESNTYGCFSSSYNKFRHCY
ncbi:hypothetical protein AB3S75_045396 [Citrus x aurantiifolia]